MQIYIFTPLNTQTNLNQKHEIHILLILAFNWKEEWRAPIHCFVCLDVAAPSWSGYVAVVLLLLLFHPRDDGDE